MFSLNIPLMFPLTSPLVHKTRKKCGIFLIYVLTKLLESYKIQSSFLAQTPNNLPTPRGLYKHGNGGYKAVGNSTPYVIWAVVVVGRMDHQITLTQWQHLVMHMKNLSKSSIVTKCHLCLSAGDKVTLTPSYTHYLPRVEKACAPISSFQEPFTLDDFYKWHHCHIIDLAVSQGFYQHVGTDFITSSRFFAPQDKASA